MLERDPAGPHRGPTDPRPRARRGRRSPHPGLPLPDREAGPRRPQRGRSGHLPTGELAADATAPTIQHARTEVVPLSARIEMEIGQLDDGRGRSSATTSASKAPASSASSAPATRCWASSASSRRDQTRHAPGRSARRSSAVDAGGRHPLRPGPRLHPRRGHRLAGAARARVDRRGQAARRLRSEGKTYVVQDGDVVEVLFNV